MKNLYYFAIIYSIFSIVGVIWAVGEGKTVRNKKDKKNVAIFIFICAATVFMIWQAGGIYKAIYRPVIRQYQGIYVRESHHTVDFVDLKKGDEEKTFYIAWLAMGKNGDLRKNEKYKVYYEKNTEIIVKIRKIS
ncbi:MAG: hypothetical protein V8R43_10235 [Dorea sp.]